MKVQPLIDVGNPLHLGLVLGHEPMSVVLGHIVNNLNHSATQALYKYIIQLSSLQKTILNNVPSIIIMETGPFKERGIFLQY